ncbi:hypothetical protein Cantr_02174 [Candida viswanathii]|uniref:Uncharacterized protein n=1 Tax=Candida viswanathii TaxID=5486 RepID=A0A367YKT2_9ASCO|nr:hypothetical protein Cantr_02174 [Candida viswanathii]
MPSERPVDRPGLSAPEELSLPLSKDRDLRDPSRTRMVSIKRPRRANFTAVDGSPPADTVLQNYHISRCGVTVS